MHMNSQKNTENVSEKKIFLKKISPQGLISSHRVDFFHKNNKRTCSAIRDIRVSIKIIFSDQRPHDFTL